MAGVGACLCVLPGPGSTYESYSPLARGVPSDWEQVEWDADGQSPRGQPRPLRMGAGGSILNFLVPPLGQL